MSTKSKKNKCIIKDSKELEKKEIIDDVSKNEKTKKEFLNKEIKLKDNDIDELIDVIKITDFKSKELMYYNMLDKYFNNCTNDEIQSMIDIINGNHLISLRFLDWFVTRYCYLYKLSINVNNVYNKENNFNINISYKAQLKSFKKKYFDLFRRKKKIYY